MKNAHYYGILRERIMYSTHCQLLGVKPDGQSLYLLVDFDNIYPIDVRFKQKTLIKTLMPGDVFEYQNQESVRIIRNVTLDEKIADFKKKYYEPQNGR